MTTDQNIHKGIIDYLMQYTAFRQWWFGFSKAQNASVAIVPIPSQRYIEEWIGGGGYCEYQFAVAVYQNSAQSPYVQDKQTESVDAAFDVQSFMGWIEEQNDAGNLPVLGENLVSDSVKVLQGVPTLSGETDKTQKMLFAAAVYYYEIKENDQWQRS